MLIKTASVAILILLLVTAFTVALSTHVVNAEQGTIYIRADGSIDPSTAPVSTIDGVTYTLTGNINDSIVVERNNTVMDGSGYTVQGANLYDSSGIALTVGSNVTIKNMNITAFYYGIYVYSSSNNDGISGNNIRNDYYGIYLDDSPNNRISENNITDNASGIFHIFRGIYADGSSGNSISGNSITGSSKDGICLDGSPENSIRENNITNNNNGISISSCSNDTVSGNELTDNGNGIAAVSDGMLTNNANGIWLYSSSDNTISENVVTNNSNGIGLDSSSNNSISGNMFFDNGLEVQGSYDNAVVDNLVNGRPLVYLINISDHTIEDAGQVVLINCSRITVENLNLSHTDYGVELWQTNNTEINGNNITNNKQDGIDLYSSNNNTLSGNNITANNEYGIGLYSSNNNSLGENGITANDQDGVLIDGCSNNNISRNEITASRYYGIYFYSSSNNNSVTGNNITDNWRGLILESSSSNSVSGNMFFDDGLEVQGSYDNAVVDNLVNGNPLVYLENVSNYSVGDAGQVVLINCSRITVENLNLSHTDYGVELWQTNNTKISGNNITGNNGYGVWLDSSSNNNTISRNNITNNGVGIFLDSTSTGFPLYPCSYNIVSGNNITANNEYGVYLYSSSNNRLYHNNFLNNTHEVGSDNSTNVWDSGYPSGGNYWSDYNGTDLYSGQHQNVTGSDGIGDTPYVIDANNTDGYPLMRAFSEHAPESLWTTPLVIGAIVAVIAVAILSLIKLRRNKLKK